MTQERTGATSVDMTPATNKQPYHTLQTFDNPQFGTVRTFNDTDGSPWFIAKDVCDALEIRTDTVRSILDDDEVSTVNPNTIGVAGGHDPLVVSEAGMYSLVLKSRKPEAKAFKRWTVDRGYLVQVQGEYRDGRLYPPYARVTPKGQRWMVETYARPSSGALTVGVV